MGDSATCRRCGQSMLEHAPPDDTCARCLEQIYGARQSHEEAPLFEAPKTMRGQTALDTD